MAWWDKAAKAAKDAADRAAYETNKVMRVQNEERALSEIRGKLQGKLADLGKLAVELYRNGTLTDPTVGAAAQELDALQAQLDQQQAKVAAIKAEQFQGGAEEAQPSAAPGPATGAPAPAPHAVKYAEPVAPVAQPAAPAVAAPLVECPNCHTQVKSSAAFCPECGTKLG